ncbi:MAG: 50S ribosomal protein L16 [Methanobacteriota archaeon]
MSRKPGRMYRKITQMAYTRREYMGGVPAPRITQFDIGDKNAKFPVTVHLIAEEPCQVRHTALESARVAANRILLKHCGALGYHMKVRVYPHHVLRENKQASGAGADRVSDGMRRAFGRAVGTAARVGPGTVLITLSSTPDKFPYLKDACRRANMKLPTPTHMEIVKGAELVAGKAAAVEVA